MKKIDIILSLVTGEGVAWLFFWFLKGSQFSSIAWLLPIIFPFLSLFCLWISYLLGKKYIVIFQLAKFVLIGAFFALLDILVLNILLKSFGITHGLDYSVFVGVSFVVATTLKYGADKYWAFEQKESGKAAMEFGSFFIITLISGGIQIAIATLIVNTIGPRFGISDYVWANIGKIGGIVVASAWNFLGYKFIVFKK